MRFLRYLFAFWTAFAVYSVFTYAFGPSGVPVKKHLESEVERLSENVETLEATNRNFLNTAAGLESDPETLSVYLRPLGYGRPGEKFYRIIGLENAINPQMFPGQVLRAAEPEFVSDKKIKITALIFGLVVLSFFITVDFLSLGILRRD